MKHKIHLRKIFDSNYCGTKLTLKSINYIFVVVAMGIGIMNMTQNVEEVTCKKCLKKASKSECRNDIEEIKQRIEKLQLDDNVAT